MRLLSVNEGLPQGQIRGMVQDKMGFIWIASDGLSRYDGRNFLNYTNNATDSSSIADNLIQNLSIDESEDIWLIYGTKEVDIMNAVTGKVRHISAEPAFRWLSQLPQLSRIDIRQASGRFFTVNSSRLVEFDKVTGKHQAIPLPAGEKIMSLGGNVPGRALLATTKALYEIKGTSLLQQFSFPSFPDFIYTAKREATYGPVFSIGQIMEYAAGNLAISAPDGILVYRDVSKICTYYNSANKARALGKISYTIVKATDGCLYYLLEEGVYRLSGNQQPKLVFQSTPTFELNNYLLADRSGMLWCSAGVKGIMLMDTRPVNFHSFPSPINFSDLLKNWMPGHYARSYFSSYQLRSAKDMRGNIWMLGRSATIEKDDEIDHGNYESALYRFNGNRLLLAEPADDIFQIMEFTFDGNNQCWQVLRNKANLTRNLVKMDLLTHAAIPFATLPPYGKENSWLTAIGRQIVYLTEDELRLYDTASTAVEVFSKASLGAGGALLMAIPDPQHKNLLWIATKGSGIVKLDVVTKAIRHFTEAGGLPNNIVYFMAPDKKGYFWCSSNKGLFRFDPANGHVVSFTVKDGLQGNEFNRYHFIELPDGHFYFGGTEGYTFFHPDSVYLDEFEVPVAIAGLRVNNVPLQQLSAFWKDSTTSNLQGISLPNDQNQLTFNFAGLQYNAPEKLQYRYWLVGIDKDWIYAGHNDGASYAAIPPGQYTLLVNTANTSGVWSKYIKKLAITILPPWWRTWWMYTIYVLLLAGGVYLFIHLRLRRMQLHQQVVLKQKEAEQAQVLEEAKSRFFANITHELRTPLTLILSPVQKQLQDGAGDHTPLLKDIYQNSRTLLRLINQLLDMSKLEAGSLPVVLSRGDIVLFIEGIVATFSSQAKAKGILLTCETNGFSGEYLFDSDKLEKILYNLLSNALKFTPENGSITIALHKQETVHDKIMLAIGVADSGIGIAATHLPHIFNRFYQVSTSTTRRYEGTGIGLSLVEEFCELMGAKIKVESQLGNGSVFTLTLPLTPATGNERAQLVTQPQQPTLTETTNAAAEPASVREEDKPLILVTDDNAPLRSFISTSLAQYYRVITAADGEIGLQLAGTELPELIISDVMMPVMDGYDLCRKIKENLLTSHIGFIMLTAKTADESRVSGLRFGADHYLGKPFIVEELLLTVANLLSRQHKLRDYFSRQLQPNEKLPPVATVEDDFLRMVYGIIETNLDSDKLDVDFLAAELAISRRTLNRKLSAIANTSANQVIRHYRLKKAAELLLSGQGVSETAYATGFSTPSWFSQCFKEMYGQSPVQYAHNGGLSQN